MVTPLTSQTSGNPHSTSHNPLPSLPVLHKYTCFSYLSSTSFFLFSLSYSFIIVVCIVPFTSNSYFYPIFPKSLPLYLPHPFFLDFLTPFTSSLVSYLYFLLLPPKPLLLKPLSAPFFPSSRYRLHLTPSSPLRLPCSRLGTEKRKSSSRFHFATMQLGTNDVLLKSLSSG